MVKQKNFGKKIHSNNQTKYQNIYLDDLKKISDISYGLFDCIHDEAEHFLVLIILMCRIRVSPN